VSSRLLLHSGIRAIPTFIYGYHYHTWSASFVFSFTNKTFPYLTITPGYKGKHASVCASSDVSVFVRACEGDVQTSFWLSMTWIL